MADENDKRPVIHEIKIERSLKAILWCLVVALMLNALPKGALIPEALAEQANLSGSVTITHKFPGYLDIRHRESM